mgnify:FL=1
MRDSVLIIAPYLGLVNRGTESFSVEIAHRLADRFAVTLVSGGPVAPSGTGYEQFVLDEFAPPLGARVATKLFDWLSRLSAGGLRALPAKAMLTTWSHVAPLLPPYLYQQAFMAFLGQSGLVDRFWTCVFPQSGPPGVAWAARLRHTRGSRILYTGHGGVGPGEERILARRPDAYVAISQMAFEWARSRAPNVHYVPNGIPVERFVPAGSLAERAPIVLSVGALTSFKRHELVVRAMELVPDARLHIVGAGELRQTIEAECRLRIPGRFAMEEAGYDRMPAIYNEARLFTLPSAAEPMGLVYLEALASGLPCVAPDDRLRRDLLKEQAIYADVEDPEAYAAAIRRGLSMITGAEERSTFVARNYSWERVAAAYTEIIERLCGEPRR